MSLRARCKPYAGSVAFFQNNLGRVILNIAGSALLAIATGCNENGEGPATEETFQHDADFLTRYTKVVLLERDSMKLAIVPSYQARVMTSTAGGSKGLSYGWINYELIKSGKYSPHINAYGGEERIWLGPEGGQFALFFKKRQTFEFANWQTPGVMDTASFDITGIQKTSASFSKTFTIENFQGFVFDVNLQRQISLLDEEAAEQTLELQIPKVKWVGYQSSNSIMNAGEKDWDKSSGLLSMWLLSMLRSSPQNTMIVPFKPGTSDLINDSYFGKVPEDRLLKEDSVLRFKGDAKYRSKIGIPPAAVKPVAGSYDALRNVLTIVQFDFKGDTSYVNSMWEMQEEPFKGDVFNAYNDGPNESGASLGEFYELESSSPAVPLKKGQTLTHTQRIFHFEGDKDLLNIISRKLLGTDLDKL